MREKMLPVWLIFQREIRDQFRDWRILFPMTFLTIIFPLIMNAFAKGAVNFFNKYGSNLILDRLVPFSVLIIGFFPITVSLMIALESFVGEKERGTIEPLLSTSMLDWQIYLGKLFVGMFTPLISSMLSISFYLIIVSRQDLNMPSGPLLLLLFVLTLAHIVVMVSAAIVVSTQSTTVRAANLLASFIVVPVSFLLQGEAFLIFWGNDFILWAAIVIVLIIAVLLVRLGLAHFQREALLGREFDMLNFRGSWRVFGRLFVGQSKSIFDWYQNEISTTLKKMSTSLILVVVMALATAIGAYYGVQKLIPGLMNAMGSDKFNSLKTSIQNFSAVRVDFSQITVPWLFFHNLRAIVFSFAVGLFSFGVLGIIIYLLNMGLVGAALALFGVTGISPAAIFFAGIVPHGIFELPALILSSAAVLHLGAMLVTPNTGKTIGEVILEGLADWAKIVVGLVVPLLIVAALIEVYITPRLLLQVLGA